MRYPFLVLLLSCFLMFQHHTQAQEKVTGSINNWHEGEAKIMFIDMFSGYTREFGTIDANGNLEIPLQENFLSLVKEAMEKEQKKASENRVISLKDLQGTYSCDVGDLEYENPGTKLSSLPQHLMVVPVGGEKRILGILSPASDPAIAQWIASNKRESTKQGKYMEWVFLEEEARVNGECYSHTFTNDDVIQEDYQYDLDLKKGWNLVQYEIQEIFEDSQGKTYPKRIEVTTITEVPEDVEWTFIPMEGK